MRKPFDGEFVLTQGFGVNKENYTQFGLQGHNGLDYGLPTNTPILAPHSGKVIEATLDPQGYGLYIKIENDVEGSVLAHMKEFRVGVGDTVTEGQLIGYSDNSGNSTGPHLHWGYYKFPRDRKNGYAGFIDQLNLISKGTFVDEQTFINLVRKSTICDKVREKLQVEDSDTVILGELDKLIGYEDAVLQKEKQLVDAQAKITSLEIDNQDKATKLQDLETQAKNLAEEVAIAVAENKSDKEEIAKLKQDCQPSVILTGFKKWLYDTFIK